jgi:hypothetical protein
VKFMCELLVFFAPLFAGIFAYSAVNGPEAIKEAAAAGVTLAAGALSIAGAPIIQVIGIVLAMLVALVGWLFFLSFFALSGINMFKSGSRFTTAIGGFITSAIPLINIFPTFTISIARIVWSVRSEDKKDLAAWEESNRNREALRARQQQMVALQAQQAQAVQVESTLAEEESVEEEQELEVETQAQEEAAQSGNQQGAANDDVYNPAEDEATHGGEYANWRPNAANDPVYGGGSGAGYDTPRAIPENRKVSGWR